MHSPQVQILKALKTEISERNSSGPGSAENKGVTALARRSIPRSKNSIDSIPCQVLYHCVIRSNGLDGVTYLKRRSWPREARRRVREAEAAKRQRLIRLQVLGRKSRVFGDSGKHFGANFDGVVESPCVFALGWMGELSMGAA